MDVDRCGQLVYKSLHVILFCVVHYTCCSRNDDFNYKETHLRTTFVVDDDVVDVHGNNEMTNQQSLYTKVTSLCAYNQPYKFYNRCH